MPARIRLNIHSRIRFAERKIDIGRIKEVVLRPDYKRAVHCGRILVNKKQEDGRVLEVIYFKDSARKTNEYFIITVYYKKHI